ncbi:caspase family protein [Desulfococcaceae bacterium HSG7]|nr:caspase family protein [Desulfococcaceae bacterium HSG7]
MIKRLFVALVSVFAFQSAVQGGVIFINNESGQKVFLYKASYALIIGVSDYIEKEWTDLPSVKEDIKVVAFALEQHGFKVTIVKNPSQKHLKNSIDRFISENGREFDNRLLIYYSGHGDTIKQKWGGEMGYLVPTDAPNPNTDLDGFLDKAIDMEQIGVYAKRIQSKHTLFLFDSCFSGSIFSLERAVPEIIDYNTSKPIRMFIVAGNDNEKIPDKSIFRKQFVAALKGEGDVFKDGYLTGSELGLFLQITVANYSNGSQHPQYGKIRHPDLNKGDFVFQLPKDDSIPKLKEKTISQMAKKIQEKLNTLEHKEEIDCKDLREFIENFENNDREHLENPKYSNENKKINEIDVNIKKLTNKLKICELPYYKKCKCINANQ